MPVNMSSNALVCLHCRVKAVKGPKCVNCERVFHPKCVERLNVIVLNSEQVICCKQTQDTQDDSDVVIKFLKSDAFGAIVKNIVQHETSVLFDEITRIREELDAVKSTNIDLIKLLTSSNKVSVPGVSYSHVTQHLSACNQQHFIKSGNSTEIPSNDISPGKTVVGDKTADLIDKRIEKASVLSVEGSPVNDKNTFTFPRYQRKKQNFADRKPKIINGVKPATSSSLRGVEKMHHFYIGRIDPDMTSSQVEECLKSEINLQNFKCSKLPSKGGSYSSFKLSIPQSKSNDILNPQIWPQGVVVRRFFPSKNKDDFSVSKERKNFLDAVEEETIT